MVSPPPETEQETDDSGATAVQIVPEVAKSASHLTVYQRTPNYIIPRRDAPVTLFQHKLYSYIPPLHWRKRALQMDFRENSHSAITDKDSVFSQGIRQLNAGMIKAQLPDHPDIWEKLTPDYAPGCKRVIASDDYYVTLGKEHVDLETRQIQRVTESGIEVDGELKDFDLIVLATGFRSVEFMYPIQIVGKGNRSLPDIWKNGAMAYYSMTVEDLPNFGMLYGPNSNLGTLLHLLGLFRF